MGQFSIDRTSLNQNFSLAENLINFTRKCRKPKPTLLLPKRSRAPKGRPKMRSKRLKSKKQKMAPTAQTAKPTPRLMPKLTELMVRKKRKATINRINRLILKIILPTTNYNTNKKHITTSIYDKNENFCFSRKII